MTTTKEKAAAKCKLNAASPDLAEEQFPLCIHREAVAFQTSRFRILFDQAFRTAKNTRDEGKISTPRDLSAVARIVTLTYSSREQFCAGDISKWAACSIRHGSKKHAHEKVHHVPHQNSEIAAFSATIGKPRKLLREPDGGSRPRQSTARRRVPSTLSSLVSSTGTGRCASLGISTTSELFRWLSICL
jgi:hypothetical protein